MSINWEKHGIDISRARGGKVVCPKCSHQRKPEHRREPCLSVDRDKGLYNCHNCGWSGNATELPVPERPKKEYVKPLARLQKVSDKVVDYFAGRGISNNTLLLAKVTESVEWMPQTQKSMTVICFNYYRDGELVNIKYRSGAKHFKLEKDAELIFYNLDCIKERKREFVIITEGEIDALSFIEAGEHGVVSVPNGASKGNQRLEYLDNCIDRFNDVPQIVLATDNDEPGNELQRELIRRLGPERCYTITYPDGCKDANEVLVKYGKQGIKNLLKTGKTVPIEGMLELADFEHRLDHIRQHGYPATLGIGWKMDEHLRFRPGETTVITGYPNSGKTPFTLNVIINLAQQHGWRFAIFCPENMPGELLVALMVQIYVGKWLYHSNPGEAMSDAEYLNAKMFISEHFFFVDTEESSPTVEQLLTLATQLVKRVGIKGFMLDPWNQVKHDLAYGMTEHMFIGEKLGMINRHAKLYNVHWFIIAHPAKPQKVQTGKDKKLRIQPADLYSISGSAHWYNAPNNGISVFRNFETNKTEVYIQKVKHFFVGKLGMVQMVFRNEGQRFIDALPDLTQEQASYEEKIQAQKMGDRTRNNVLSNLPGAQPPPSAAQEVQGDLPF